MKPFELDHIGPQMGDETFKALGQYIGAMFDSLGIPPAPPPPLVRSGWYPKKPKAWRP